MMATMFAKEYIDQAHIEAEAEARRKLSQEINENFEKGKTDDYALKKAILSLCEIIVLDTNFDPFIYVVEDMTRMEIPRERQKQGLENIIREILVVAEKDEKNEELSRFYIFVKMLGMFPDYDLLPILKEGIKSKNEIIREDAQKYYNDTMEKKQNQTPNNKGKEIKTKSFQSKIKFETTQTTQKTKPKQPEKTSNNKTFFWVIFIIFFIIISGLIVRKKKT